MRTQRSHAGGRARSRRPLAVAALGTGLSALLLALSPGVTLADVPPTASFVVSANYGPELPVQFDASKSSDPDGTIVKYTWTFGDGSEGSGVAPAHTYSGIGSYEVTLTVEDDAHLTAMTKGSVAVEQAQTIGFTSTAPEAAMVGGATYTAQATATSGLAVSFSSGTPAVCAVSGATVSFIGAGSCTVLADQEGNDEFAQAVQQRQSFAVGKGTQTIGFTSTAPEAAMVGGTTYTAQATATSGLPVSFSSGTPAVCAISGAIVSFIGAGTCTIVANQPGDENYDPAPQATQSFGVAQAPASIPQGKPPAKPPALAHNSNFAGHASYNTKTGAITVDVTVSNPGRFTWRAIFANGKFGVFAAARTKCRGGQLRLQGKCRRAAITFGKGVTIVTGAGAVTFVIKPSRAATKALKSRVGRKNGVPVSLRITYQSSLGGAPVSHRASLTVKLKR